jgi:6-phosphogluconolactonase
MAARKTQIRVVPDGPALFSAAAEEFACAASESIAANGSFSVALSGGSTPKGLFSVLVNTPAFRGTIAWDRIRFFWGDERHVPPGDPDSNFRMAQEALLSHVSLRDDQVFRIPAELSDPAQAADDYERKLREAFRLNDGQLPRFDLILLGMGPDGHTASLFPGTKALRERKRLVVSNWVGKLDTFRITLTAPVINAAMRVLFLVGGEDKAPALKGVLEGPREPSQLPAQLVRPTNGSLMWLIDAAAGRMLAPTK